MYAISGKAKDVRLVVQELNLGRQARAEADLAALSQDASAALPGLLCGRTCTSLFADSRCVSVTLRVILWFSYLSRTTSIEP